jgi:hypothetical protein
MTPVELLAEVSRLGIILEVDGEGVRYKAPVGALTSELKDALRAHKAELRQLLAAPPADCLSDTPCPVCGSCERWSWFDERTLCRVCTVLDLAPLTLIRRGWDRPTREVA